MSHERRGSSERDPSKTPDAAASPKVGASSLVQAYSGSVAGPAAKVGGSTLVEKVGGDDGPGGEVHQIAAQGVAGDGRPLPHGDTIQRAFGRHDISGIQAHTGGDARTASRTLGAEAYATGHHVAFAGTPSLHTAAHEAAHVVQQRSGVQLKGGVGSAGDAYEQHADAVADRVVQGGSAQDLLDGFTGGGGGRAAVQRQVPDAKPIDSPAKSGPDPATVAAVIKKLDAVTKPSFAGIKDDTFSIDGITTWVDGFAKTLGEAKAAAAGGSSPDLTQAVDRCLNAHAPDLTQVAEQIRTATIQLSNDSSVAKSDPKNAVFPSQDGVKKLSAAATQCTTLSRDAGLPASDAAKTSLQSAAATTQDAALAMLQSLSVVAARDRWKKGKSTETPGAVPGAKSARTELDDIFKDAGWSDRVNADENGRIYDWCGMFVVSSYVKGAGLASKLRAGFYHVDNVKDFFQYQQAHNPDRAPASIWADGQWWGLQDYHKQRGSVRLWTPRDTIQASLKAGNAPEIRPGDTCLIDHGGGNSPSHIVMVESYNATTKTLVTIEGNTYGVHADKDGKAERLDDDHLKDSAQGSGTAAGIHERDMSTLAPGPATYTVKEANAYVREDSDITKFKMDGTKKVALEVGSSVVVTEVKTVAGAKYGHLEGGGWTKMSNLASTAPALPKGAAKPNSGATVWGVGRPSVVDFEDGHEYAVHDVPAALQHTSPDDIKALAKKKGKEGAQAKAVGVK